MLISLVIADVLMILSVIWKFRMLPPQIPLLYSQLWGENQLVDTWLIVIIPLCMHVFYVLNQLIYRRFFWQNHTIKHIVRVLNFTQIILFTAIFLRIIFLVT